MLDFYVRLSYTDVMDMSVRDLLSTLDAVNERIAEFEGLFKSAPSQEEAQLILRQLVILRGNADKLGDEAAFRHGTDPV